MDLLASSERVQEHCHSLKLITGQVTCFTSAAVVDMVRVSLRTTSLLHDRAVRPFAGALNTFHTLLSQETVEKVKTNIDAVVERRTKVAEDRLAVALKVWGTFVDVLFLTRVLFGLLTSVNAIKIHSGRSWRSSARRELRRREFLRRPLGCVPGLESPHAGADSTAVCVLWEAVALRRLPPRRLSPSCAKNKTS